MEFTLTPCRIFRDQLSSICEDIIYLSFCASLPPGDRETIINARMLLETHDKIKQQGEFFSKFRPFQPVFDNVIRDEELDILKDQMQAVWRASGWQNMKRGKYPSTRDIAEKVDPGILGILYDYFFRLTSSLVHFSPRVLLRTGWGDMSSTMNFSTGHLNPYYLALSQVYGIFLFCLYFEYFWTIHTARRC